jgi:hypothetical protein
LTELSSTRHLPTLTIFRQAIENRLHHQSLAKYAEKELTLCGHFMALVDRVLEIGGKVGAIIPISFLHGNDTCDIRKYYLENYSIEYIIKPSRLII